MKTLKREDLSEFEKRIRSEADMSGWLEMLSDLRGIVVSLMIDNSCVEIGTVGSALGTIEMLENDFKLLGDDEKDSVSDDLTDLKQENFQLKAKCSKIKNEYFVLLEELTERNREIAQIRRGETCLKIK